MNITVYLGASAGNDPAFLPAVQELGNWIGANGHALVYGGSKSGLMGALADSVLEAGGHVTGVEPSFFIEAEFQHDGIDSHRDERYGGAQGQDDWSAFIAFPGGTGTLEEIAEVMSAVSLGHLSSPCILYNLDGYYNDLKALLGHMIDKGLSSPRRQHGIYFADDLREIASIING
ncbi:MAG: TIGR00730 family Rossman fold protein [Collinsella aerofaciens]